MEAWLAAVFGGIGVALIGVLSTIIVQRYQRHKTAAEAKSTDADYTAKIGATYDKQVETLLEQVESMAKRQATVDAERAAEKAELIQMREKMSAMQAEIDGLRLQVRDLSSKLARVTTENAQLRQRLADVA